MTLDGPFSTLSTTLTTLPATLPREIHATQRNEKEEKYGVFDDDDAAHQ